MGRGGSGAAAASEQAPPQLQPPPQEPPQQQPQQPALTQQQIQQLVAPIALYPDPLLAQVLTASTYPLEVTLASRWVEKNPSLKGSALESAMQQQPWDPSVKGLTSVPQVLAMMNEKLDWTNQLGEAFLAQPDDVQNAIQASRKQAEVTGNLNRAKSRRSAGWLRQAQATQARPNISPSNRQSLITFMCRCTTRSLSTAQLLGAGLCALLLASALVDGWAGLRIWRCALRRSRALVPL